MNILEPTTIPNPSCNAASASMTLSPPPSASLGFQSFLKTTTRCRLSISSPAPGGFSPNFSPLGRRISGNRSLLVSAVSHEDSKPSDIGIEDEGLKVGAEESHVAWQQMLKSFKEQSLKLQSVSKEAYKFYSEKAMILLHETSGKLKIQAEKASQDLSVIAKEITEESKEYFATAADNYPEPVKDIVDTFTSSHDELDDVSKVRDFYVGIPYGAVLSFGGFLSFMLTGSIPAIRFGIILGGTLLALSISSLKSWKKGDSAPLVLKGQAAIATVLFLRQLLLLSMRPYIFKFFTTIVSGGVAAFYLYRIIRDRGQPREPNSEARLQD
ncbi:protein FATTY ACID EXPORT 3, chloroplastic-like [Primulina tabacum]|uniref:protein FATTY ACID EXPORT 3, chloroplastic-like n=1 Tax=Primulina tabacum TaxID=48773 RepID=UPI003F5ACAF4